MLRNPEIIQEPELRDAYTKQNAEMYSFISKKYRRALQTGSRPHHVEGSGSAAVQAVENDFCGAMFVLLDLHCSQSYKKKLSLEQYFTAAPGKLAGSDVIMPLLKTLQNAIHEATRLGVKTDFVIIRQFAEVLRERSTIFTEIVAKYLGKSHAEIRDLGWENDSLPQFDLLISEAIDKLRHSPISISPAGNVNQVNNTFDTVAAEIDAYGDSATTFSVNASKAGASDQNFRDKAAFLQQKCKLICCVKDCDIEVRNFIARRTTEMMLEKNLNLADHEALCAPCHRKLEIDQEVTYLTMKNGKRRERIGFGGDKKAAAKRKDGQGKDAKDKKPRMTVNGKVNAMMEILENIGHQMGSNGQLGTNPADLATKVVEAPAIPPPAERTPTTSFTDRMVQLRGDN
jgi:hypothetical protein